MSNEESEMFMLLRLCDSKFEDQAGAEEFQAMFCKIFSQSKGEKKERRQPNRAVPGMQVSFRLARPKWSDTGPRQPRPDAKEFAQNNKICKREI